VVRRDDGTRRCSDSDRGRDWCMVAVSPFVLIGVYHKVLRIVKCGLRWLRSPI